MVKLWKKTELNVEVFQIKKAASRMTFSKKMLEKQMFKFVWPNTVIIIV